MSSMRKLFECEMTSLTLTHTQQEKKRNSVFVRLLFKGYQIGNTVPASVSPHLLLNSLHL